MSNAGLGYIGGPGFQSFTWDTFWATWTKACRQAYESSRQVPKIRLPFGVFPDLTGLCNPITGDMVTVERYDQFPYDKTKCTCCPKHGSAHG